MHISFVIPAYNEEVNLPKCLDSIKNELSRTDCDFEVIVVNNASTDNTEAVAKRFARVRVVNEPRKGLVRARSAGYVASSGELVANVDADTILPTGWLQKVLDEFSKDPSLAALSGPFIYHDLSKIKIVLSYIFYGFGYISYILTHFVFKKGAMLQGGNFILRRRFFDMIGGFDTTIDFYGEDTDVAVRISRVGKVKWTFALPIYASGRRLMHEGMFKTGLRYAANYFNVLVRGKPLTTTHTDIRVKD